ncbi:MAG: hypothetical protein KatS3mg012_2128 [Gaiellaceae bacterium]|jgi:hypothetical protein|nr:MAG: hypothetical protein KatS3mg012_2128 [Gaiellaceae bacterium]
MAGSRQGSGALRAIFVTLVAVAALAGAAVGIGRMLVERQLDGEIRELLESSGDTERPLVTERDLASLPGPVQRWLRWASILGTRLAATAHIRQRGDFRLAEERGWIPFSAEQTFTTEPPGFVWRVRMTMAKVLVIAGRDRYVRGDASIRMRILWLVPVAGSSGTGLDRGALARWLGEIVWFPTAALSERVAWEELDRSSARATISYAGATASGIFTFDAEGRPVRFESRRYNDARKRDEDFSVSMSEHGSFAGVRIPTAGNGVWHYEKGDFEFIRWHIDDVALDESGNRR